MEMISQIMNSDNILKQQNDEENLIYLKARRYYYDKAKLIQRIRIFVALSLPALAILSSIFDLSINNLIAIISSIWLVVVFVAQESEKYFIKKGAKAQEYFDVKLFGLTWNNILIGTEPSQENIIKASEKANKNQNYNNWYSGLEAKEYEQNVLLAQRMSIVWASRSMCLYKWFVLTLVCIYFIITLIYSLAIDHKLQEYLIVILLPSLPIFIHSVRSFWNLLLLSRKYSEMGDKISEIFKKEFINPPFDSLKLREIQNFVFIKRCETILVPNWFYNLTKINEEQTIKKVNEQLSKMTWN